MTIVERFREQAIRAPHACAVSYNDEKLTYNQLDARSDQLAKRLVSEGAKRETLVGVALPRSIDLVVALLAIMKTGAAYLPLDPSYPSARLNYLIEDACPVTIVTSAGVDLPDTKAGRVLLSDFENSAVPAALQTPQAFDAIELHPEAAAYVIYTSGSTGRPKGVVVPHRAFLALLDATVPLFDFGPRDVWSVFHSYAFDFSVWEIWAPLLTGGRAVIVPQEATWSADEFLALLDQKGVTVLNQTPTAFAALNASDAVASRPLENLRLVIFGGEALDPARLRSWFSRRPNFPRMVNMYGITETTVHVTAFDMKDDLAASGGESPIGLPLSSFRHRILDDELKPVLTDSLGELYLGGNQMARGYLRRPSLTATRFVADPAGGGGRLYRSGDLVRLTPDGLGYIGRADFQLAFRGFRIEPGEVEAAVTADPRISASAVAVRQDPDGVPGDTCLVAYVVSPYGPVDERALRNRISASLPAHLVPARIIQLAALPLTPNNKLDRDALPEPAPLRAKPAPGREALLRQRLAKRTQEGTAQ